MWMSLTQTILTWSTFFLRRLNILKRKRVQRLAELSISITNVIMSGYVIVNFMGGRLDKISCPSNLYFSIWLSFLVSIWIFSTLLETWNK